MSSSDAGSEDAGQDGNEPLSRQVAELAGEMSEAESPSRRRKLAKGLPTLATRGGKATWQGLQAGSQTSWRGLQAGSQAGWQSLQSGSQTSWRGLQAGGQRGLQGLQSGSLRGLQAGRQRGLQGLQAGGQVGWRAVQAGGQLGWQGLQAGSRLGWRGLQISGQWLASQVVEMAPRIPIRSLETLRSHYPGQSADQLADTLIEGATRAAAGVGATIGAAAALPFVPAAPMELGVETLALVAIEIKLIAELHEVYGARPKGGAAERMVAYLSSWADKRGAASSSAGGLATAMTAPLRRKLERRLAAKAGKAALSLAPMLTGAAAGALINQRETRKLGNKIRADLAAGTAPATALPARPG